MSEAKPYSAEEIEYRRTFPQVPRNGDQDALHYRLERDRWLATLAKAEAERDEAKQAGRLWCEEIDALRDELIRANNQSAEVERCPYCAEWERVKKEQTDEQE